MRHLILFSHTFSFGSHQRATILADFDVSGQGRCHGPPTCDEPDRQPYQTCAHDHQSLDRSAAAGPVEFQPPAETAAGHQCPDRPATAGLVIMQVPAGAPGRAWSSYGPATTGPVGMQLAGRGAQKLQRHDQPAEHGHFFLLVSAAAAHPYQQSDSPATVGHVLVSGPHGSSLRHQRFGQPEPTRPASLREIERPAQLHRVHDLLDTG
mmetsp:Transcript_16735/g.50009  ORF Transcript_16735/g.50009 Transcript_16735/m.50009 type:complete len:208 (+) Transcript_16735:304-927(+)